MCKEEIQSWTELINPKAHFGTNIPPEALTRWQRTSANVVLNAKGTVFFIDLAAAGGSRSVSCTSINTMAHE